MKKVIWFIICFMAGTLASVAVKSMANDVITDIEVERQYQETYQESPVNGVVLEPIDE